MFKRTFQFRVHGRPVKLGSAPWRDWHGLEPTGGIPDEDAVAMLCEWHPKFDWRVSPEPRLHGPQILDFVEV